MEIKVKNRRIEEDKLLKRRREWLSEWPTGKEVDFLEAVEYQKTLPESKIWWKVTKRLHKEDRTVVFPRAGVPLLKDQIELSKSIAKYTPLIPVTTDSYSRSGAYDKAQKALDEVSGSSSKPLLNGFPVVNHGVKNTRKLIESCDAAFSFRAGDRLNQEIAIASGMTAIGGAGESFIVFWTHKKDTLEHFIENSQYANRLCGWYADRGVIISSDIRGWQPTAPIPLSVCIACQVVDALLAAEQGLKAINPLVFCLGHMAQDLAWIRLVPKLMREYLDKFGYQDAFITGTIGTQIPLFPVPVDWGGAFAFLNYTAIVAALAKCEVASLRTIDEGAGIPTQEAHELSYKSAKWILDVVREQMIEFEIEGMEIEEKITEIEVRAILDKLLELGDGDIAVGAIRGVEIGVIDSPWSPNINVKSNVLGVRDNKGACRYLEFGDLPIPSDIKEFHRERVAEREKAERRKIDYYVAVEDLEAFSKGKILGTPISHIPDSPHS